MGSSDLIFLKKYSLFLLFNYLIAAQCGNILCSEKKIVALMQVRNEENIIEQSLRILTLHCDAIVVLDDGSDDSTCDIITNLQQQIPSIVLLKNTVSSRIDGYESQNSQKLLNYGRFIGGTHFIVLDADEMFSSNCLLGGILRTKILSLQPGDSLSMHIVHPVESINFYKSNLRLKVRYIFCDSPLANYSQKWLHSSRIPDGLTGNTNTTLLDSHEYVILHFTRFNWKNLKLKYAWYSFLERIRNPEKKVSDINAAYNLSAYDTIEKAQANPSWFKYYKCFDESAFNKPDLWRKRELKLWLALYGENYFSGLDCSKITR